MKQLPKLKATKSTKGRPNMFIVDDLIKPSKIPMTKERFKELYVCSFDEHNNIKNPE